MESNFTDLKHKTMIKKIEGLRKYTDCSMPSNEQQRIEKAECAAYNQAIDDVVKLFSIHNVVGQSEQIVCQCGAKPTIYICDTCSDELVRKGM